MKLLIYPFCLVLLGCATTKPPDVFVAPQNCGKDLKAEFLVECSPIKDLPISSTFEEGLTYTANLKAEYKKCAIKAKALQETLQACRQVSQ